MQMIFKNARIFENGGFTRGDATVTDGVLRVFGADTPHMNQDGGSDTAVFRNCIILPGFCDVHVHLREPGFSYKETIGTGTAAAAHGGYTAVCAMPNLDPVPDSREHLEKELALIRESAHIPVYPYGALTVGEKGEIPAALEELFPDVIAFSDDGRGVQDEGLMRELMRRVASLGGIVTAHCEDNRLLHGGYIHDGEYARLHGHKGIPSESEWRPIERDLRLARETGCAYHVCHISAKESVSLIREAKKSGVNVTAETAPHYLLMDDSMLREDGRFKMNPPVRDKSDREALVAGLLDGTIDMIATDHAPHAKEEKSRGLAGSAMGIVGLETAFPLLYTGLVRTGILPMEQLVELMAIAPRKRFGIPLEPGSYCVFDTETEYTIDPETFLSQGRATPFAGWRVHGKCLLTVYGGKTVWQTK